VPADAARARADSRYSDVVRVGVVALLALAAVLALLYLRRHDTDPRVATRDTVPASAPAGQETTSARIDVPDGPGVAGRVLDEAWRPIAGAVVESDGARARSDAEGRFVLPAGTRRARVRATGYVTGSAYWDSVARAVEVVLARGGALAGTVRDAEGRPVAGAGVRAGEVEATADGDGRYSLPDLPAGFLAAMDVRAPGRAWQELARLPERPVRASETTAFDPVVETGVRVSGTAPPGATVVLEKDRARTRADAQGRFHFDGVTPGRYGLRLDPGPYHTIHVGVGGLAGLTLAAPPRATLEVRSARRPGTLRIAGNTWHASPDPDGTLRFVDVLATSHAQLSIGDTDHGALALPAGETTVFTIPPPELVFAGVIEAPDGSALAGAEVQVHDEAAELRWIDLEFESVRFFDLTEAEADKILALAKER